MKIEIDIYELYDIVEQLYSLLCKAMVAVEEGEKDTQRLH